MICRICLQKGPFKKILNIFDAIGIKLQIAAIVQQHFWFEPMPDDLISNFICDICWLKINDFHNFYMKVEEAHLKKYTLVEVDKYEQEILANTQLNVVNLKEEIWQNSDNEFLMQITPINANENPLYEPEVCEANNINTGETDLLTTTTTTTINLRAQNNNNNNNNDNNDDVDDVDVDSDNGIVKLHSDHPTLFVDTEESSDDVSITSGAAHNFYSLIEEQDDDEIIKKHIPLGCDFCTFVGETFNDIVKHFKNEHKSVKPYVICCGRKIKKKFYVKQHAYKHEDPEYFKCHICNKIFSNGSILRTHTLNYHTPEKDLIFACENCPRKFPRRYLLEQHKSKHVPINERKFICDKCPGLKAFASDHTLKIHMNWRHRKPTNVCHVCAKKIHDNRTFEKHVRLHFEDSGPRLKCTQPGCDRWLKDEDNLKVHLRYHNLEGKSLTCKECGIVCKNIRSLRCHMRYKHSNETFTCEICNKIFKRALALKEHMAQHTGKSLYKCPFCSRKFNSNANMHSHKKRMHPLEWDVWRKTKRGDSQHAISNELVMQTIAKCLEEQAKHRLMHETKATNPPANDVTFI